MEVLIVEDDLFKLEQLDTFMNGLPGKKRITHAKSVHSAKEVLLDMSFDIVLMDISLPAYDIAPGESGGRPQTFGGRELLRYMDFVGLEPSVVVVTQFERFGTGEDAMDIRTLQNQMKEEHGSNFLGVVYFQSTSDAWKRELATTLAKGDK